MKYSQVAPLASALLCRSVAGFLPSANPGRRAFLPTEFPNQDFPLPSTSETTFEFNEGESRDTGEKGVLSQLQGSVQRVDVDDLAQQLVAVGAATVLGAALLKLDPHLGTDLAAMKDFMTQAPVQAWNAYESALANSPLATKAATSGAVYGIGDIVAQRTEGVPSGDLDKTRITRSLLAGLIGHGPLSHFWYQFSEGFFNNVLHCTEWWSFAPKILLDQTTWGPVWNNTYILLLGLMKLDSLGNIWGDMKKSTLPLIANGLKLWVPVHCITYGLIPVENRLLWVDLVEIVWVTILASQAASASNERPDAE